MEKEKEVLSDDNEIRTYYFIVEIMVFTKI
jgi:hypothetical protein